MSLENILDDLIKEHREYFMSKCNLGIQQCKDEIIALVNYLDGRKFNHFWEIGSDEVGSLWLYKTLLLNDGAKITATDIVVKEVLKDAIGRLNDLGFDARWVESSSDITDIDSTFDLLHIDGDHSYEAVKNDFNRYYDFVEDGGVILIHDTLLWDGCIRLREEIEKSYKCITFAGHDLISKHWGVNKPGELSTGITLVHK